MYEGRGVDPLNSEKQSGPGEPAVEQPRAMAKTGPEGQRCYSSRKNGQVGGSWWDPGPSQREGGEWFGGSWWAQGEGS